MFAEVEILFVKVNAGDADIIINALTKNGLNVKLKLKMTTDPGLNWTISNQ